MRPDDATSRPPGESDPADALRPDTLGFVVFVVIAVVAGCAILAWFAFVRDLIAS